jgi:WD40 repeat protein
VPAHKGPVTNLVITEAGVWSSSPKDNQILLWDRKKNRVSKKVKTTAGVNGLLFVAPFHVWSTSQNTITLWDAKVPALPLHRR